MTTSESVPIRLSASRVAEAAEVLGRAFANDPFVSSVFPDAETRPKEFAKTAQCVLRFAMHYGEVYAASEGMEGFAAWLPSSKIAASWLDVIRFGGIALPFTIGLRPLRKLFAYMDHSEEMRERRIRPPYWYLQLLGVDPRRHGKGHGALLLRSMLSRLDRENIPSCLDTENESNVAMYEHFGFRVVESSTIPRTNSPIWLMAREVGGTAP